MKTTFVSTLAIQNAMQLTMQRAQSEIMDAQKEVVSHRHADIGLELGAKSSHHISLTRDVERMNAMLSGNALVTNRLSASQNALTQMGEAAQATLNALLNIVDVNDQSRLSVIADTVTTSFSTFTSFANASVNGEYLLAGVNTDVRPMAEYSEPGSAAKVSFDAAYLAYFGHTQNDPLASSITVAQMDDFLTNHVEPLILGAGWDADWSNADSTVMTSRISANEVVDSSATINADGPKAMAMASVIIAELLTTPLADDTRSLLVERATGYTSDAISGINHQRAELGLSEQRIEKANNAINIQINVMSKYVGELESVDPYEASTRLTTLITQMEISYQLTARIQQLSLTNYL